MGKLDDVVNTAVSKFDSLVTESLSKFDELLEEYLGDGTSLSDQIKRTQKDLVEQTTDTDNEVLTLRALVIYRRIVQQVKSGGSVRFYGPDGESYQTLKVRIKK